MPFVAKATTSCDIDIDADNVSDVRFLYAHSSSPSHSSFTKSVLSLSNIEYAYISNSSYADTIPIGATVSNLYNWKNYTISLYYSFSGPPPPWGPGNVQYGSFKTNNNYLGFRKIYPNDTLYGWILLDASTTIKIKSIVIEKKCNAFPDIQISTTNTILCVGETATLIASGMTTYTWSTVSTNSAIVVNPTLTTSYTVNGTNGVGCIKSAAITVTVDACIGIQEYNKADISIYPNPANKSVSVIPPDNYSQNFEISIINSLGEIVLRTSCTNQIDVSALSNGIYNLQIVSSEAIITKKIVIQH